nr:cache domain-containing protein [Vibrio sinus]
MLVILIVIVSENHTNTEHLSSSLRQDLLDSQKKSLKRQIENIAQNLEFDKSLTVDILKDDVKEHVQIAHSIATDIYEDNQNLSKEEIGALIVNALDGLYFNQGSGYFYIFKMDGVNVLHPMLPELQGTSLWNSRTETGRYDIREHIELIQNSPNGGAYFRWWHRKPQASDYGVEKIRYGKYFEPLDWFIGTEEYITPVDPTIVRRMLSRISEYGVGQSSFVYVIGPTGKLLAHRDKMKIGETSIKLYALFSQGLMLNKGKGGAFVKYDDIRLPAELRTMDKITFVKSIPAWGWIIASDLYLSDIDKLVNLQIDEIKSQNLEQVTQILLICVLLALVLAAVSVYVSRYVQYRFVKYQDKIDEDFFELQNSRQQLEEIATLDSLTKLPNRLMLEDKILSGIEDSQARDKQLAVLFVDLDDFKKVNDQHGHHIGDELLKAISRKFEKILGDKDILIRFGGDEFILCFPLLESIEQARQKAQALCDVMSDEFILLGTVINTSCSIGVAMFPGDGTTPRELLSKADIVLYRSKEQSKGAVMFYDKQINEQVQHNFALEDAIRNAVQVKEFEVWYEPRVDAKCGKVVGVEIVTRWCSATLGHVPQEEFIPVAETTGMITSIGYFSIKKACSEILQFSPNHQESLSITFNVSAKQLMSAKFALTLHELVVEIGIDANRVILEISEEVFAEGMNKLKPVLDSLHQLGFEISLRDLGKGYSSLRYLNILPINEIKIDREFVADLHINPQNDSLVKTIAMIGVSNNIRVSAEGVENIMQKSMLVKLGCQVLQGKLFENPLSFQEFQSRYLSTISPK